MLESKFQKSVIDELKARFPGIVILKNDPSYIQGFPDLTLLWENTWATLECKGSERSPKRPNQEFYVNKLNEMSFSSFIYPENKEDILHELEEYFMA